MIKIIVGLGIIGIGIFLEILWLGVCFGSIIIGICLLIFAPKILFFPFNFFSFIGINTFKNPHNLKEDKEENLETNKFEKYYEILESNSNDDFITIKNNYRRLIKEYHYDTIVSKNLPKEMLQFAENKTKELNEAYSMIKEIKQ